MNNLLIYGAYGYTGRLIVEECLKQGIKPIIAGRSPEKAMTFANKKGLEYDVFEVTEREKLEKWLKRGDVVIHCAGPFIHTAKEMVQGCLATNTHYLDITGEFQVFDLIKEYGEKAKQRSIMLLPGAGFDVVPSDCLAKYLHTKLPSATDLKLAFVSKGGKLSKGTAKTMIENMGDPQTRRRDGDYEGVPMGKSILDVDYGEFKQISMGISWGDISTAYHSTGIPNIEVFSGTTEQQISKVRKTLRLSFMLKSKVVKNFLIRQLDKRPDGPKEKRRKESNMYLWGEVSDGNQTIEARLLTPNGYTLTALTSVMIAQKILTGDFKAGFQTPSTAYGEGLIEEVEGCRFS
ncbi:MAG: saccharopine dehydrogenase NADP-binding domain-containing protein [Ekhidna sp.]|uniref:saccharopine dehydrogenase family protein n=1 Tax=Ekhidna sp. TaxID=2608089 RepID=UPI0032EE1110